MAKLWLILFVLVLSACEDGRHLIIFDPHDEAVYEPSGVIYPVFFDAQPMQLAMYEPINGSYKGIYTDAHLTHLDNNKNDIANLENFINVSHAAFMDIMHLGDPFPYQWALECIAEQKTPIIMLIPPQEGDPFDFSWQEVLTQTATSFNGLQVPMFVMLYPIEADSKWDKDTYIAFFRYARALFEEHAPHVAFVWNVHGDLDSFMDYYPGNLATDWVSVSYFSHVNNVADMMDNLEQFYHYFHTEKPIMLNFGISHFSKEDHRYRIAEVSTALKKVYGTVKREFPRIKMVNYMDINRLDYNGQDYRISFDATLKAVYKESVEEFTSLIQANYETKTANQPKRMSYSAHVENEIIYLDVRLLEELGWDIPEGAKWIGEARRIDSMLLKQKSIKIENGRVLIEIA